MHYMLSGNGWMCQFLEEDLKTALPRKFTFKTSDKVVQMAERGGADMNLAGRQALDHGLGIGRGGLWLLLDGTQYRKLQ